MKVEFQVAGETKRELEASADRILTRFLDGKAAESVSLDAHPLLGQFGIEGPVKWEADVKAEV